MDKLIKIILENDIIEGFGKKRKKKKKKKAEAAATVTNDDGSVTTADGSTVSGIDIDYGTLGDTGSMLMVSVNGTAIKY